MQNWATNPSWGLVYCSEKHAYVYSFEEERCTGPDNGNFFFLWNLCENKIVTKRLTCGSRSSAIV